MRELRSHRIVVVAVVGVDDDDDDAVGVVWGVSCASIYLVCDFMSVPTSPPVSLSFPFLLSRSV